MSAHPETTVLFTVALAGPVTPESIRVAADPDDDRVYVWAGSRTRITFPSVESVEQFANLLLDRLTDLQFARVAGLRPAVVDAARVRDASARLLALVHDEEALS